MLSGGVQSLASWLRHFRRVNPLGLFLISGPSGCRCPAEPVGSSQGVRKTLAFLPRKDGLEGWVTEV